MDSKKDSVYLKLVVVGDGNVGKTCMLLSYTTDKFPTEYVPTVFENYTSTLNLNGKQVCLSLWDTAGQENYSSLRTLAYENADVFLIIFSVINKTSYENAKFKWYPELNDEKFKKIPKIIVGNKIDSRNDANEKYVQFEEAQKEFQNYSIPYKECSALTREGLKELFQEAVQLGYKFKQQNSLVASQKDQPILEKEVSCCQTF